MEEKKTIKGRNGGTLTPIQKGEVRNPKGKKPGTKNLKTIIKEISQMACSHQGDEKPMIEAMVYNQILKAIEGDTSAFREIADRLEGKPIQAQYNIDVDQREPDKDILNKFGIDY